MMSVLTVLHLYKMLATDDAIANDTMLRDPSAEPVPHTGEHSMLNAILRLSLPVQSDGRASTSGGLDGGRLHKLLQ